MKRSVFLAVLVASLGYFVDIYDLILFLVVRVKSLKSIGVPDSELLDRGVFLLNLQMIGMLTGGVLWGVLGDKRGRLSVLFGSIFLYSVANLLNGFVHTVPEYAALRFVAGLGLAGELGAGVTLASEILAAETRGFGTTIIAGVGVCGAIVAALVARAFSWQIAYLVGGGLGLGLLALRVSVRESEMFLGTKDRGVSRGSLALLFSDARRVRRYLGVVLVGVPIWYAVGILIGLSPEICSALGLSEKPDPGRSVMAFYAGATIGDFGSGLLSQLFRSRKKVLGLFLALTAASSVAYFLLAGRSLTNLYLCSAALGAATGYWAVFVTVAAEQFGTNLRATTTTTAPNVVRGAVVPMTAALQALRGGLGVVTASIVVGIAAFGAAAVAVASLEETFGRDLDYLED